MMSRVQRVIHSRIRSGEHPGSWLFWSVETVALLSVAFKAQKAMIVSQLCEDGSVGLPPFSNAMQHGIGTAISDFAVLFRSHPVASCVGRLLCLWQGGADEAAAWKALGFVSLEIRLRWALLRREVNRLGEEAERSPVWDADEETEFLRELLCIAQRDEQFSFLSARR
eukprot:Polyplicarium_translucidae@DN5191_c0_g1_i1.p3